MSIHPDCVTPHIANLARRKGFIWFDSGKIRQDEYTRAAVHRWLRTAHNIDVCFFPAGDGNPKRYKFYVQRGKDTIWNPVTRNGEGKVLGYQLFDTFEEGMEKAFEAALLFLPTLFTSYE